MGPDGSDGLCQMRLEAGADCCQHTPMPPAHLHPAPAAEVGAALGVAVAGLPALLLLLAGDRAAALLTSDAAVIAACASLVRPLALLMLSE